MIRRQSKTEIQRSVGSKDRAKTNRQTDRQTDSAVDDTDCFTLPANAVDNRSNRDLCSVYNSV